MLPEPLLLRLIFYRASQLCRRSFLVLLYFFYLCSRPTYLKPAFDDLYEPETIFYFLFFVYLSSRPIFLKPAFDDLYEQKTFFFFFFFDSLKKNGHARAWPREAT